MTLVNNTNTKQERPRKVDCILWTYILIVSHFEVIWVLYYNS